MSFDNLMKELQESYLKQLPARAEELDNHLKEKNWKDLKNEFHKIKGSGGTYGLPELSKIAQEAELHLNKKTPDSEYLYNQIQKIKNLITNKFI